MTRVFLLVVMSIALSVGVTLLATWVTTHRRSLEPMEPPTAEG